MSPNKNLDSHLESVYITPYLEQIDIQNWNSKKYYTYDLAKNSILGKMT